MCVAESQPLTSSGCFLVQLQTPRRAAALLGTHHEHHCAAVRCL